MNAVKKFLIKQLDVQTVGIKYKKHLNKRQIFATSIITILVSIIFMVILNQVIINNNAKRSNEAEQKAEAEYRQMESERFQDENGSLGQPVYTRIHPSDLNW